MPDISQVAIAPSSPSQSSTRSEATENPASTGCSIFPNLGGTSALVAAVGSLAFAAAGVGILFTPAAPVALLPFALSAVLAVAAVCLTVGYMRGNPPPCLGDTQASSGQPAGIYPPNHEYAPEVTGLDH